MFLGPPGAGKGTQAQILASRLRAAHLASGEVFREAILRKTPLGRRVERIVRSGKLVPDELATAVILERLKRLKGPDGFILDGFPRTRAQAVALDRHLTAPGGKLTSAFWFLVRDGVIVRRLSARLQCIVCRDVFNLLTRPPRKAFRCDRCGGRLARRLDDEPRVVRRRLQVFHRTARPLLAYYRRRGVLLRVNGERGIRAIQSTLVSSIRKLRTRRSGSS